MLRALLTATLVFGIAGTVQAAEESSTSGDRLPQYSQPRRGPPPPPHVYRPKPDFRPDVRPYYRPEPRYHDVPRVRYGNVCVTRRFECDMRYSLPVGSDCECRAPGGGYRSGIVH